MTVIIEFKKLHPEAKEPTLGTEGAAGFDLTAVDFKWDYCDETDAVRLTYDTGLAVAIPEGYVGLLVSRSSITKYPYYLHNSVGIIDSDYRGPLKMKLRGYGVGPYAKGERIGQLVIVPRPEVHFVEVDELDDTDRGEGGFGHTGK